MFKKISGLVLLLFVVTLFAADDTYQIVMLGDLHYDNVDCREPETLKNLQDWQKYELNRNLRSWKEDGDSFFSHWTAFSCSSGRFCGRRRRPTSGSSGSVSKRMPASRPLAL